MTRKPNVDRDVCIGCGLCAETLPEVFQMTEENLAVVHNPTGASELRVQEVIDECPVSCIHWT